MDTRDDVKKLMVAFEQPIFSNLKESLYGDVDPTDGMELYADLIAEEYREFETAYFQMVNGDFDKNIIEVADSLVDMIWVIEGFALSIGIPLQKVWDEVARSNFSKIPPDGKILKRADGKGLKPPTYSPPDIEKILFDDSNIQG